MAELILAGLGLRAYGNVIFNTDNAYDIGASGANRARDLFLARNAVIGGTLDVTGLITSTAGISGGPASHTTGAFSSTLNVTGQIGLGTASVVNVGLKIAGNSLIGTSADQYGFSSEAGASIAATGSVTAAYLRITTQAFAFTTTAGYGAYVAAPSLGNTAVTSIYGLYVANQGQAKSTTVYGLYIADQSGAATTNIGLYNGGITQLQGNVGIGTAVTAFNVLRVAGSTVSSAGTSYSAAIYSTWDATTTTASVVYGRPTTAAAAFTVVTSNTFHAVEPSLGAGSAITTQRGMLVANQGAAGITHAYGIYIAAQSGAATTNIGLYNLGTTQLNSTLGMGSTPLPNVGLYLYGLALTTNDQYGMSLINAATSAATSGYTQLSAAVRTAVAAFTVTTGTAINASGPALGAGSAVTTLRGIAIENQGIAGVTHAYGLYIGAQSGAATTNIGLYNLGTSRFAGTIGIGSVPIANAVIYITGALTSTGVGQYGLSVGPTLSSAATGEGNAYNGTLVTAAAAFTLAAGAVFQADAPTIGAGSAITTMNGVKIGNMGKAGITNAYGLYIAAQSGAATTNMGINNQGSTLLRENVGVGTSPVTSAGIDVEITTLTSTTQFAVYQQVPFSSAATTYGVGFFSRVRTTAAAFTMTTGYGFWASTPNIGAASAITTLYGFYADNQGAAGVTNAYGVYIAAQSGAATTNIGLYNAGTTTLAGVVTTNVATTLVAVSGDVTFGASARASALTFVMSTAAGYQRDIGFYSGGIARWYVRCDGVAESGANVGSDFAIIARDDAGANLGSPITAKRSTLSVGIGVAPAATVGLYVANTLLTSTDQRGVYSTPIFTSAATLSGYAMYASVWTANAAFTMATGHGLLIGAPNLSNTAVTTIAGLRVDNQGQAKTTTAYGIYISAQSGAVTTNIGLYNVGTTRLDNTIGMGIAPLPQIAINMNGFALSGSTTQQGISVTPIYSSATVTAIGVAAKITTAAAAYTLTSGWTFWAATPVVGATSAITYQYGLYVDNQGATGISNAWGVYIAAQSGATTTNVGLYNGGTSVLVGAVGINIAPSTSIALRLNGAITTAGTSQYSIYSDVTFSSAATSEGIGIFSQVKSAAAAFTMTYGYAFYASTPSVGAASAITTQYGFYAANQGATGVTHAYGVYIAAVSGAATTNIGLYNVGTTRLDGSIGVGASPNTTTAIYVQNTALTGTTQYGIYSLATFSSAATAYGIGIASAVKTAAGAWTQATGFAIYADAPSLGNTAVTSIYGLYVANQGSAKSTSAYGVYIASQSGAVTTNIGLYNAGTSHFASNIAVGNGPQTNVMIYITGNTTSSTDQYGILAGPTFSSAGTGSGTAVFARVGTAAAAYLTSATYGVQIAAPTIGAGSTITTANGLYVGNQGSASVANAYGIYIVAQSGAATTNIGLYNAGLTSLNGKLTMTFAGAGNYVAEFQNTTAGTPYGVWIKDAAGPTGGYPLFNVSNSGSTATYFRVDSLSGTIGVGTVPSVYVGMTVAYTALTGTTQIGISSSSAFSSTATSVGSGFYNQIKTAAAAFTLATAIGYYVDTPSLGATSAVTTINGFRVENLGGAGRTNAYGVYIVAQSGAATLNIGLYNGGTSTFAGHVTMQDMLTINGSGSRVGVGTSALAYYGILVAGVTLSGASAQVGIYSDATFGAAATTAAYAFSARVNLAAAAFTATLATGLIVQVPTYGAGSAATTMVGLQVKNQGHANAANAYGIWIEAQSGSPTTNMGIYNASTTRLDGAVAIGVAPNASIGLYLASAVTTGTTQYGGYVDPAFTSAATAAGYGLRVGVQLQTGTAQSDTFGIRVVNASRTGTATITNLYGIYIDAQSGAATTNIALYNGGTARFNGALGFGANPLTNKGVNMASSFSVTASGAEGYGFQISPTIIAAANSDFLYTLRIDSTTTPGAYTGLSRRAINIAAFSVAAFTSPGIPVGLYVDTITGTGATAAYGIYVNAPVGATSNVGIYNSGKSTLVGAVTLGAGSTTAGTAPLKFTSQSSPLTVVEQGAMELVGNSLQFSQFAKRRGVMMSESIVVTTTTVANTTVESGALITAAHGAGYLEVGKHEEIALYGTIAQRNNASAVLTVRVKYGGVTKMTMVTTAARAIASTQYQLFVETTVRTTGATGTMQINGRLDIAGETAIPFASALATIDTTAAQDTTVTFQWGEADVADTVTVEQGHILCIEPNR